MNIFNLNPASPVLFWAEILGLLAIGSALVWFLYDAPTEIGIGNFKKFSQPFIENEKDLAGGLGWEFRTWVIVRVAGAVVGILVGIWSGVVVAILGLGAMGILGLPWVLKAVSEKNKLKLERVLVDSVRKLRDAMEANTAFDQALRDLAENPPDELAYMLAPLKGDSLIADGLVEANKRARSSLASLIIVVFLISRTRNQEALKNILSDFLIPVCSSALAIGEEASVTSSQQRTIIYIMVGIMGGAFLWVSGVTSMHEFYTNIAGQITLIVIGAMFMGLVYAVNKLMKSPDWTKWDISSMKKVFEGTGIV